ncbi:MAG: N-acetylmuramoyl-L-alanine amidase [Clostridia bacterium]|nr:N-acetylmuramoyl-L-alanine amidase [Clostridia bacterium]
MRHIIKWSLSFIALSTAMIVAAGGFLFVQNRGEKASTVATVYDEPSVAVVIDPGHGGEDGGCIGGDGTLEKELNLSVAKKVYDILTFAGIKCEMTRKDDVMLYDAYSDLNDYSGVKKTYDLKNRVRIAKESECKLFVSIHMNKFADEEYKGLQVYYSANNSDSITAALRIQSTVKDSLQNDNEREIKRAGSNIYILHRSQMPAVLVECGFLSNSSELEMLKDSDYQKSLALCISAGITDAMKEFQT